MGPVRAIALPSLKSGDGREGREGRGEDKRRTALRAEVLSPLGDVVCYCVHLDAFAGRSERVRQIQPVLEDAQVLVRTNSHPYPNPFSYSTCTD